MAKVILIEGPDRCGKTTLAKLMAESEGGSFKFLPSPVVRPLIFSGELNNPYLFFADTLKFWSEASNTNETIVLDRDILSMLAYQGFLLGQMDPMLIIKLYRETIYTIGRPDEIVYIINGPFVPYDQNDPFEKHGYSKIRECYEKAIELFEANFSIPIKPTEVEYDEDFY